MNKHPSADYPASLDAIAHKRHRRPSAEGLKAFFNRYHFVSPHAAPHSQQKVKTDEDFQKETASYGKAVRYFQEPADIRPGSTLSSVQGYRPSMEDKHVVATFHGAELFGVFDGHGGKDVAIYVSDNLPQALLPVFLNKERGESANDEELARVVTAVYRQLDRTMCENGFEAGSCALVSIFDAVKKEIFVINLGDSRALLFTNECQQLLQTFEKSPADDEEKARIQNAEHMVIHRGVERIDGVLAVSRAFGDSEFKTPSIKSDRYSGSHGAVSVVPMFHHLKLKSGKTYYLILACDGLWTDGGIRQPFTNDEIMQLVALKGWTAKDLTKEAIARGSGDNVTAMVIRFDL